MAFDLATATPVSRGFDLSTARPVDEPDRSSEIPKLHDSNPDRIPEPEPNTVEKIGHAMKLVSGVPEAALSTGSNLFGGFVGAGAGALRTISSGADFGTPEGIRKGDETAARVRDAISFRPRSEGGKEMTEDVGKVMGLAEGLPPHMMVPSASSVPAKAITSTTSKVRDFLPQQDRAPVMAGVGSAETDAALLARERAGSLPVPIKLSKGQAERDFEQLRFERETAKQGKAGKPLREHADEQNEKILQNFDAWVDQTGAQAPSRYHVGRAVDEAVMERANAAKLRIKAAYKRAEDSGHMSEPVATQDIVSFLNENRAEQAVSPLLKGAEQKLIDLGGAKVDGGKLVPGQLSVKDMETFRQSVGNMMSEGPNMKFGRDVKIKIDAATEGKGGELYRDARKLRSDFAREFEDHAIVDRLMSTKPGTKDRSVAFEDVFDHSILKSDYDSLKHFRTTLHNAGPKGEQAWKELQGQTIEWMKSEATKGVAKNERRQDVVSPAALKKSIRTLDADGKLDLLFGKKGAQQVRDLGDIAQDIYTVPSGTVNPSGTASIILEAISNAALGKLPTAAGKIVLGFNKYREGKAVQRKVRDALDDPRPVKELINE